MPSGPVRKGSPSAERRRLARFIAIAAVALPLVLARAASLGGADQLWVSLLAALGFGAAAVLPVRYFRPRTSLVVQVAVGVVVAALIFGAWWYFAG
ncbi:MULTISPECIES: hypothetical protein [unclassified Arthrobacter]|uniref:hypothetical protein n=1 Tax=unclassified Arthrobacter TaxID=235627 RepID=UPI0014921C89|nr:MULTISPECIES: hypothetical protein [unclassified Arthrobacter]